MVVAVSPSFASEIETRYATVVYEREELLKRFNDELRLRSLSYMMRGRSSMTLSDEVRNKVEVVIDRVQNVLEMFPRGMKFRIVLLASEEDVAKVYRTKYYKNAEFIAFYAPREKTIYVSVRDATLHVLAHEVAHVVIDHYFGISPSVKIHEVLSQYVEANLED
ncbi:MAG: hypothetical protein AB1805_16180 [Nitrospirota bacterium]